MISFLEWLENYTMMNGQNVNSERPHGQMGSDGRIYGAAGGTAQQHPDGTWRSGPSDSGGGGSKGPPPTDVSKYKKGKGQGGFSYSVPVRVDVGDRQRVAPMNISLGGAQEQDADQIIDQLTKALKAKGFQV